MSEPAREGSMLAGRYRVGELLGRGGMGTVYKATDSRTGQDCALKLLDAAAGASLDIIRFKREFRAAARLSHPTCVKVFELGQEGDQWFFTMEYVDGGSLERHKVSG